MEWNLEEKHEMNRGNCEGGKSEGFRKIQEVMEWYGKIQEIFGINGKISGKYRKIHLEMLQDPIQEHLEANMQKWVKNSGWIGWMNEMD